MAVKILKKYVRTEATLICPGCHDVLTADVNEDLTIIKYSKKMYENGFCRVHLSMEEKVDEDEEIFFQCPTCEKEQSVQFKELEFNMIYDPA